MKRVRIVLVALGFALIMTIPLKASGSQAAKQEVVLDWPTIWVGQDSKTATVDALETL